MWFPQLHPTHGQFESREIYAAVKQISIKHRSIIWQNNFAFWCNQRPGIAIELKEKIDSLWINMKTQFIYLTLLFIQLIDYSIHNIM